MINILEGISAITFLKEGILPTDAERVWNSFNAHEQTFIIKLYNQLKARDEKTICDSKHN